MHILAWEANRYYNIQENKKWRKTYVKMCRAARENPVGALGALGFHVPLYTFLRKFFSISYFLICFNIYLLPMPICALKY
jgi:hypothetical protein